MCAVQYEQETKYACKNDASVPEIFFMHGGSGNMSLSNMFLGLSLKAQEHIHFLPKHLTTLALVGKK